MAGSEPEPQLGPSQVVFIAGAGTMGAGIAQVAAGAGHPVKLFDSSRSALEEAQRRLRANLEKLVSSGKLSGEGSLQILGRIEPVQALSAAGVAGLVVEAIAESLPLKRQLFQELEGIVSDACVLASNTSSLSVTAIAQGLRRPERCVGLHFFNPVPQMRLVEIVSGLRSAPAVAASLAALAERWGKVAVHARSTPGFIVNRVARPFYAEALALLQERAAEPASIDRCLRGAGFRMGACELMDLIGHDVNAAVTEAIYQASFNDKRYVPSPVQRELIAAGWLGRKSGRGFFDYGAGQAPDAAPPAPDAALPSAGQLVLHGQGAFVERLARALASAGRAFERRSASSWSGLAADGAQLRLTDGRPAGLVALHERVPELGLVDLTLAGAREPVAAQPAALAWTVARAASPEWQARVPRWLAAAGWVPCRVQDTPGLVVARTLAMLINEAADAVQQGVCNESTLDRALQLGVNYPGGPFEWLSSWHDCAVVRLLDHLDEHYRGERYRVSPELRQRAWRCESQGHSRAEAGS
jgi:3-hydroxybutyryl-CoA dehydrogenase